MSKKNKIKVFYEKEYRQLLIIPIGLFILAIMIIGAHYIQTGAPFSTDVTLSGGIAITIHVDKQVNIDEIEQSLKSNFRQSSINLRVLEISDESTGLVIEDSNPKDEQEIIALMRQELGAFGDEDYSVEQIGSSLSKSFFREMFIALFFAFLCMGGVFFYYFRALMPTLAAIISAFFDIFITLGIIVLMGVRLTSGGIAAFLMLIGYSIDTSILLSTKVLKGDRKHMESAVYDSMKTGLTMSAAGLAAMWLSYLLTNNTTLRQIMLIIVIGLLVDIVTTWILNVSLLRIYLEKNVKD